MNQIAVLITCHNRKGKTLSCLRALSACNMLKGYSIDIFLVDDGSTDGTSNAVKEEFPYVNIIFGDGNLYWNRGMVLAWEHASKNVYDFYLWLNDDTILFEDGIILLLEASFSKDNKSIIVGSTISESAQIITYGGRTKNSEIIEPNGLIKDCHHFNGNIVLIPKHVFDIAGKLDPTFHHAIGDFDYGLRAKKMGIDSFIASEFVGKCEGHSNFPNWCNPSTPLFKRIRSLYRTSCECHPKQFFFFEKRHYGSLTAINHFFSIHFRVLLPRLWSNRSKH
ncbi:glycosyltransferase family 2 protein [Emticicia fluvialis]|uniref:glycosyltransferase family 2 protein n=1 Tax=Emticicia fluvialis TaxID=2974474 RepID=UPI002166266F|nr:glycosyltransferase family 2 protein [Emticicia fluvialis]